MRKIFIVLTLAAYLLFSVPVLQAQQSKAMTNVDVVDMVTGKLSEQIITTAIRQAPATDFDLAPTGLLVLKKAGVSDAVIVVMQEVKASAKSIRPSDTKMPADDGEPATNDPNATLKQELLLIEHQLSEAYIAGDKATLKTLLSDGFILNANGKSYNKAWVLDDAKPRREIKSSDVENATLSIEGEIATLIGVGATHMQNGSTRRNRFADKFVKRDGRWQLVAEDVKPNQYFIKGATTEVDGRQIPDAELERTVKDIKKIIRPIYLADKESEADFLLVVNERNDTVIAGQPNAKSIVATLYIRESGGWKPATKLKSGSKDLFWSIAAENIVKKAVQWVNENAAN